MRPKRVQNCSIWFNIAIFRQFGYKGKKKNIFTQQKQLFYTKNFLVKHLCSAQASQASQARQAQKYSIS